MEKPLVSVIVPAYNTRELTKNCIESLLIQSFREFEIIIIDDCSNDGTWEMLQKIKDERIKLIRTKKTGGPSASRNVGIKNSKGKYVFSIDGDCVASKNWIKEGVKIFEKEKCVGVEGSIYYVSKNYKPTAIDRITENKTGGLYMTASMAYTKEVLDKVGQSDEKFMRMHDREFAFKAMKYGRIIFCPKMSVIHQHFLWTFKKLIDNMRDDAHDRVILLKRFGDKDQTFLRIYRPINLLGVLIPPFIMGLIFIKRFRKLRDFKILLWTYPAIFVERISLWKNAIKEKVFLI